MSAVFNADAAVDIHSTTLGSGSKKKKSADPFKGLFHALLQSKSTANLKEAKTLKNEGRDTHNVKKGTAQSDAAVAGTKNNVPMRRGAKALPHAENLHASSAAHTDIKIGNDQESKRPQQTFTTKRLDKIKTESTGEPIPVAESKNRAAGVSAVRQESAAGNHLHLQKSLNASSVAAIPPSSVSAEGSSGAVKIDPGKGVGHLTKETEKNRSNTKQQAKSINFSPSAEQAQVSGMSKGVRPVEPGQNFSKYHAHSVIAARSEKPLAQEGAGVERAAQSKQQRNDAATEIMFREKGAKEQMSSASADSTQSVSVVAEVQRQATGFKQTHSGKDVSSTKSQLPNKETLKHENSASSGKQGFDFDNRFFESSGMKLKSAKKEDPGITQRKQNSAVPTVSVSAVSKPANKYAAEAMQHESGQMKNSVPVIAGKSKRNTKHAVPAQQSASGTSKTKGHSEAKRDTVFEHSDAIKSTADAAPAVFTAAPIAKEPLHLQQQQVMRVAQEADGMVQTFDSTADSGDFSSQQHSTHTAAKLEAQATQETQQTFKMQFRIHDVIIHARMRQDNLNLMIDMREMYGSMHEQHLGDEIQSILGDSGFKSYRLTIRERSRKVYDHTEKESGPVEVAKEHPGISVKA